MKIIFEARLVPRIVGSITQIIVRVENSDTHDKCIELLAEKFPEYDVVSILRGYQANERSSSQTSKR